MSKLCLYTLFFPFGNGESFLIPEVEILAREFDQVIIFPLHKSGEIRSLPENVKCVFLFDELNTNQFRLGDMIKWAMRFTQWKKISSMRYEASNFKRMLTKSVLWSDWFRKNDDFKLHYSYWFDEWVTILGLAREHVIEFKLVSRAHGFDLYQERAGVNGFPYRKLQFKSVESVHPVSKDGEHYLRNKFPEFSDKISLAYLGSKDAGFNSHFNGRFHVVSVANLIELKRVALIIEFLKLVNKPIKWTHFGDGKLKDEIERLALELPDNVEYNLRGTVPHDEILESFHNDSIDVFLSLSSSEGLPVSMMEAQSAGIPIVATNVGGVSEIVNKQTGILLEPNPKPIRIAKTIDELMQTKGKQFDRNQIRKFWKDNFNGELNFKAFCNYLKSL